MGLMAAFLVRGGSSGGEACCGLILVGELGVEESVG